MNPSPRATNLWIASSRVATPRNDDQAYLQGLGGVHPLHRHCEERSDDAIHKTNKSNKQNNKTKGAMTMATNQDVEMGGSSASSINYSTYHNDLASQKAGASRSVARVYTHKTYTLKELAGELKARGVSLTRGTIFYVLQELADLMQDLLAQGNAINLGGIVRLFPVIRGVFEDGETFDDSKHAIVVRASAGKVVRGAASAGPAQKRGGSVMPMINSVKNAVTFEDDILFALTTATVKGKNLGYDASASDEGLFLDAAGVGVEVISATATEINFRLTGEVATETTAVLSFKTRGGDKNLTDPTVITRTVTLKPAE